MLCIYKKEAASDWFCRYEKTEILQKNKKIEKFGEKIKFAYLIPSYHNPTGVVASIINMV